MIAAEKGLEKIAVEIKNFTGPSDINEFHRAMGQFNDYDANLEILEPDRILFLARAARNLGRLFQEIAIQRAVRRNRAKIIVYNPQSEKIEAWIS